MIMELEDEYKILPVQYKFIYRIRAQSHFVIKAMYKGPSNKSINNESNIN